MRKILLGAVGLVAIGTLIGTTTSDAATTSIDLSTTGSVVAGIASAQPNQELAFAFTTKNNSTTTSANLSVRFTVTNGTVSVSDYICPLISSHLDISADTPACETGALAPGKTASTAILVGTKATGTMTVKACSSNLNGDPDPVSSNDCKTLSVKIIS